MYKQYFLVSCFFLSFALPAQIKVYTSSKDKNSKFVIQTLQKNKIPFKECNISSKSSCKTEMTNVVKKAKKLKKGEVISTPVIVADGEVFYNIKNYNSFMTSFVEKHKQSIQTENKTSVTTTQTSPNIFESETPKGWTKEQMNKAFTLGNAAYLSREEKKVIYLMNLARIDGKLFAQTFVTEYITSKNMSKTNPDIASLLLDLNKTANVAPLMPTEKLAESALFHAEDMGKTGGVGHDSSDGTDCFVRVKRFAPGGSMAENCSYGYGDALGILMQLLIDAGVPSRGHRNTILSPVYAFVGVSIQPHKKYSFNCVQDFSDRQ